MMSTALLRLLLLENQCCSVNLLDGLLTQQSSECSVGGIPTVVYIKKMSEAPNEIRKDLVVGRRCIQQSLVISTVEKEVEGRLQVRPQCTSRDPSIPPPLLFHRHLIFIFEEDLQLQ